MLTISCTFSVDGEWFINPKFEESYGYQYRSASIPFGVCHGTNAILKSEVKNHPEKKQITELERKKIMKKMQTITKRN